MARAAKKEPPLTTEEKMAKALVPEEEQPYPVPGNWCWVRLGSLYEINPKNEANDELEAGFVPMDKISAGMCTSFNFDVQPWLKAKKGHVQFADGDVAFAKISPCFENRKAMIVGGLPNGIGAGTTEIIVLRQPSVNNRFTFWLISTDDFIQKGRRTYSGTVGQQRISMDYVRQYPIPLPPLPEQQRIVTLIESLFADLDAAKDKLQAVLDGFAKRRAALLHRAFTGELTREWREEQGVDLESWKEITLGFVCQNITYGYTAKAIYNNAFPKMLRITDIQENGVNWEKVPNCEIDSEAFSQYELRTGDIVFARTGATTGKSYLIENPPCAVYASYLIRIRLTNDAYTRYVYHFLQSTRYWEQISDMSAGIAQPGVNAKKLKGLCFPLATLPEQKEIVRILDDIFAKESQSKATVESALAEIDTMKKAILATAFRGGFETNNSSDESAMELLRLTLQKPPCSHDG